VEKTPRTGFKRAWALEEKKEDKEREGERERKREGELRVRVREFRQKEITPRNDCGARSRRDNKISPEVMNLVFH
jgi:hypothetical protein